MKQQFIEDVLSNPNNAEIFARWNAIALPDSWLVAGCLFQTVWNRLSNQDPTFGIKDYDIFYFDCDDSSAISEQAHQERVNELFKDLNITIEVCNQARVHQWYPSYFGHNYSELKSAQEGIDRFLIPSTCVGMSPQEIYVPNGFEILYQGVLAMNPLTPYQSLYEQKAQSYQQRWPWLQRMQ